MCDVYIPCICVYQCSPVEGTRSPGAGVAGHVSYPMWALGSELRSSGGPPVLLTAELSLQAPFSGVVFVINTSKKNVFDYQCCQHLLP